jgi:hypothetical protein
VQIWISQFFGSGSGASPTNVVQFGANITLTNSWAKYTLNDIIPNVAAFSLGNTGDDATYLQIRFPTNSSCDINIAKPSLYAGNNVPQSDFDTDEQIESLIETPRTGDIKVLAAKPAFVPKGWLYMNDTTIGNAGSGATGRANIDTWFLFNKLYNNFTNTQCPVSGGRTGNAANDWGLGKTIRLPLTLDNIAANASSAGTHTFGESDGLNAANLILAEIPNHRHDDPTNGQFVISAGGTPIQTGSGSGQIQTASTTGLINGYPGQQPVSRVQPTIYLTYMIKL